MGDRRTPQEHRKAQRITATLIVADYLLIVGLSVWGFSLASADKIGAFLAVMLPTIAFAVATAVVLNRRWLRLEANALAPTIDETKDPVPATRSGPDRAISRSENGQMSFNRRSRTTASSDR